MPTELKVLGLAGLLQLAQYLLMGVPANLQLGVEYTTGPRDEPRTLTGIAGRLKRALDNHFEALIMFTLAVVVVTLAGRASGFTAACAWTYLGARVLYVPAYALGTPMLRSLIWMVAMGATAAMLVSALL